MKNISQILSPALFFITGIIFIVILQNFDVIPFLNSGFFIALVTFSVGLFAIYLYKKQQEDSKRDSAKLILQEIRYAEQQVRSVRTVSSSTEPNYYLGYKLLPTNSWHKNIHLFVNNLSESQIDLVSNFYSQASYLDELISIISHEKNRTWNLQETVPLPAGQGFQIKTSPVLPNGFHIDPIAQNQNTVITLQANATLADVTSKIEFIYNSPAIDMLRLISEGKA